MADRLREVAGRLQTELDSQASTLGAERARFQEAERLAKTHEASRDALGAAKVEVARRASLLSTSLRRPPPPPAEPPR